MAGRDGQPTLERLVDHSADAGIRARLQEIAGFRPQHWHDTRSTTPILSAEALGFMQRLNLHRLLQDRRYGGCECSLAAFTLLLIAMGAQNASAAWLMGVYNTHTWITHNLFADAVTHAVFTNQPDAFIAGCLTPIGNLRPTDSGFALSGTYHFISGISTADFVLLGAFVEKPDHPATPEWRLCLVRSDEVKILRPWTAQGLALSDSASITLDNVFVSQEFTADFATSVLNGGPRRGADEKPLFRLPWRVVFPFSLLGGAIGPVGKALEHFVVVASERKPTFGVIPRTYAPNHIRYGRALCARDAAQAMIMEDCREIDQLVHNGGSITDDNWTKWQAHSAYAVHLCRTAVDNLCEVAGAKGYTEEGGLNSIKADVELVAAHMGFNVDTCLEPVGSRAFGFGSRT